MKRYNFNLDDKWMDKVRSEIDALGLKSLSAFVRMLIIDYFKRKEKKR